MNGKLLNWYYKTNRNMPWRDTSDPYKIWISEIMLQQTRVATAIPYYINWIHKYPTIYDVHHENIDNLLKMWEGLGYYSRVRNFKESCDRVCSEYNIKLIYFSTSYVYPGKKGNYSETDSLLPWNNYAWSKLGGECAVQMYKNSLILRVCMTEKPFVHKKAFTNVKLNFIFHEDLVKILIKLLNKKGVINVGGNAKTVYNFAKKFNPNVKKIYVTKNSMYKFPLKPFMNISKLKKIIN